MKIYCSSCGNGMTYTSERPNFCVKCGKGLGGNVATASQADDTETENDSNEESIPQLDKLDFEVITEKPAQVTFGSIFEDAKNQDAPPQGDAGYTPSDMTPEEVAQEFKREAGTLRPKQDG